MSWSDGFMSQWDKTYVSTNISSEAVKYDANIFQEASKLLAEYNDTQSIRHCLIAVIACAIGRADLVGRYFDNVTQNASPAKFQDELFRMREAITIVYPFLGPTNCIPACYGMIGVVQRKGEEYGPQRRLRNPAMSEHDVHRGQDLRGRIYRGVGNSMIFGLMEKYFTELYNCSTNFTWGYLVANTTDEIFSVRQAHLIVAAAITALGATRQTRSHIKATIGVGNSVAAVQGVVDVVAGLSEWDQRPFQEPDVKKLVEEIRQTI